MRATNMFMTNKQVKTKLCELQIHVPILSVEWDCGTKTDQRADDWEVLQDPKIFEDCLQVPKVKKWREENNFADQMIKRWQICLQQYYNKRVADEFDEEEESDNEDKEMESSYEQARKANIARNNAVLHGLGLGPAHKNR